MSSTEEATARRPPRRRTPWSLRSIVIEVTGKPMSEFQEVAAPRSHSATAHPALESPEEEAIDPVDHFYPPLTGARARAVHGPKMEHHADTLERHRIGAVEFDALRSAPPPHPERIYLHYLLLHLDRLSLSSLWYLRRQVNDEISARARPPPPPPG
jgi:hypothetical protein